MTEDNLEPDEQTPDETEDIKTLRKKAKKYDEVEARAVAAERKLALRDAGLQLSDRQVTALVATHQGDWEPESLKATATELGWYSPPEETTPDEEVATHQRMTQAETGGQVDPKIDWDAEIRNAKSPQEVLEISRKAGRPVKV